MPVMRFRVQHIMLATAALAVILFALDYSQVAICDGWYDIRVECDEEASAQIEGVSFIGVNGFDTANIVLNAVGDHLSEMNDLDSAPPFDMRVGHSHRASMFGRTWGHVQEYSHVVVVLFLAEGSKEVHCLTVPHRNEAKQITIDENSFVKVITSGS